MLRNTKRDPVWAGGASGKEISRRRGFVRPGRMDEARRKRPAQTVFDSCEYRFQVILYILYSILKKSQGTGGFLSRPSYKS